MLRTGMILAMGGVIALFLDIFSRLFSSFQQSCAATVAEVSFLTGVTKVVLESIILPLLTANPRNKLWLKLSHTNFKDMKMIS